MDTTTSCDSCIQEVDRAMQSLTKVKKWLNHLKEEKSQPSLFMATIMLQISCLIEMCTALAYLDFKPRPYLEEKRGLGWKLVGQLSDAHKTMTGILRHAQSNSSCSTTENST